MTRPDLNPSTCPYCGKPTPKPGMRCRDRVACAERADYAYITDALGQG